MERAIALDAAFYCVEELFAFKGFDEIVDGPSFNRPNGRPYLVLRGKKHQGCVASHLCLSRLKSETAYAGQPHVQHDATG